MCCIYHCIFIYSTSLYYLNDSAYLQGKVKSANPFEKISIIRLHSQLKNFAKQRNITLDKNTADMQCRERKVVARTFNKVGIVVPYDKKTQLGYRDLAVTDSKCVDVVFLILIIVYKLFFSILYFYYNVSKLLYTCTRLFLVSIISFLLLLYYLFITDDLQKILKQIEKASTVDARKVSIIKLDEIVRLATIAADECDFGTCLELGHDLFSSGGIHVQNRALQMLSIAYTHLHRPELLKIFEAHLKNRRKGCELSVI